MQQFNRHITRVSNCGRLKETRQKRRQLPPKPKLGKLEKAIPRPKLQLDEVLESEEDEDDNNNDDNSDGDETF